MQGVFGVAREGRRYHERLKPFPQTASAPPRLLIFTDLDGTLLDHHTYSFDAARTALARLDRAGIPVILTTSKTLPEVLELKQGLGNRVPCIVENGSSVWIPAGYFMADAPEQTEVLGLPVEAIRAAINALPAELRSKVRGFQDMSVDEVAAATELDRAGAKRAMQRSASEPFVWSGTDQEMRSPAGTACGFRRVSQAGRALLSCAGKGGQSRRSALGGRLSISAWIRLERF